MLDSRAVNPLPRQLVPGLFWLGACFEHPRRDGEVLHSYNSAYLVSGSEASLLVEAGFPGDVDEVVDQIDETIADFDLAPLKYVFLTHQETPHASGADRILRKYPDAVICGDIRDYHLAFPSLSDRLLELKLGQAIDLGDRKFRAVRPVIRDLNSTLWGFDEASRTLFPGDGFAYGHVHTRGHCGCTAEESPSLPLPEMVAMFAEYALHWTRFTDMGGYVEQLKALIDDLGVERIGSTHGLPITDIGKTVPLVYEGLWRGSQLKIEEIF